MLLLHEILHPGAVAGLDEGTALGIVEEIAGVYRPTAGHIFFQDHGIAGLGEQQQERGIRQFSLHVLVMYMGKAVGYAPADDLFDNPLHPYSQALLSAVPRVGRREEPIALRSGPPSSLNPPAGCSFRPRCHRKLGGVCEEEVPELIEERPKHLDALSSLPVIVSRQSLAPRSPHTSV
jgi:oligopeptide/dipeptide ABC transporter ATP-binding protein